MKTRQLIRFIALAALAAMLLAAFGCGASRQKSNAPVSWTPKLVAVLPFMNVPPDPSNPAMARSPLTGAVFTSGGGVKGVEGVSVLDRALSSALDKVSAFKLVPAQRTWQVFRKVKNSMSEGDLRALVAEVGRRLGADGVLVGHLYRYRDRVGGGAAVEKPASVAFDLAMVRVGDKAVVWKNSFDETQKSLSEDIFNLSMYATHGLRWYPAKEFAEIGMGQLMARFPWRPDPGTAPEE